MRQPGIEPGSTAWKAAMLTTIPLTLYSTLKWQPNQYFFALQERGENPSSRISTSDLWISARLNNYSPPL